MTTLTVSAGGTSYSYDASPGQVAGLGAEVARINSGKQEPVYAADINLLEESIGDWLAANPGKTPTDVVAMMAQCVSSWEEKHFGTSTPLPPAIEEAMSDEAKKNGLLARSADRRWRAEIAGTTWNGHGVATDRASQQKLLAEFVAIAGGLRTDPSPWKFKDGFVMLSNADMSQAVLAARAHVAACFAVEGALEEAILAGHVTTDEEIDAANWPA